MISNAVIKLCEAVKRAGGRALLAGGWVRDFARGVENVDYDIEVYGLEAPVLRSLIEAHGKVDAVGEAFTVYKVRLRDPDLRRSFVVDVSLPRRESKTGRGHRGFVIEGDALPILPRSAEGNGSWLGVLEVRPGSRRLRLNFPTIAEPAVFPVVRLFP